MVKMKSLIYAIIGGGVKDSKFIDGSLEAYGDALGLTLPYLKPKDTIGSKPVNKENLQDWKKILEERQKAYQKGKEAKAKTKKD